MVVTAVDRLWRGIWAKAVGVVLRHNRMRALSVPREPTFLVFRFALGWIR